MKCQKRGLHMYKTWNQINPYYYTTRATGKQNLIKWNFETFKGHSIEKQY